jgi:hypothetical protein
MPDTLPMTEAIIDIAVNVAKLGLRLARYPYEIDVCWIARDCCITPAAHVRYAASRVPISDCIRIPSSMKP